MLYIYNEILQIYRLKNLNKTLNDDNNNNKSMKKKKITEIYVLVVSTGRLQRAHGRSNRENSQERLLIIRPGRKTACSHTRTLQHTNANTHAHIWRISIIIFRNQKYRISFSSVQVRVYVK